jgi:hypothetical protein
MLPLLRNFNANAPAFRDCGNALEANAEPDREERR